MAESLFLIYLKDLATLNAVYGAFGGIMALLLWIYQSGCIFIFGACLCAALAESRVVLMKAEKNRLAPRASINELIWQRACYMPIPIENSSLNLNHSAHCAIGNAPYAGCHQNPT